jgi:NPCBM/NEW2 domain
VVQYRSKILPKAIFMHPPPPHLGKFAALAYSLNGEYSTFDAEVSLRDGPLRSEVPVTFHVIADGKPLWKSNPITTQTQTQKCSISVKHVKHLKIAVSCDGPPFGAHAIWIDPRLSK